MFPHIGEIFFKLLWEKIPKFKAHAFIDAANYSSSLDFQNSNFKPGSINPTSKLARSQAAKLMI